MYCIHTSVRILFLCTTAGLLTFSKLLPPLKSESKKLSADSNQLDKTDVLV